MTVQSHWSLARRALGLILLSASLGFVTIAAPPSAAQSPAQRDMEARARVEREQDRRDQEREELKTAAEELAEWTGIMMEEVAAADGYTTSARLVEATVRIEEAAKRIESLAKTVKQRAQGR
jgi:hypothetical protein